MYVLICLRVGMEVFFVYSRACFALMPFHSGYRQTCTFANHKDPEEMALNTVFYQGLYCGILKIKTIFRDINTLIYIKFDQQP